MKKSVAMVKYDTDSGPIKVNFAILNNPALSQPYVKPKPAKRKKRNVVPAKRRKQKQEPKPDTSSSDSDSG